MVSIYTDGLDFRFQSISELWILNYVLYYDINIYINIDILYDLHILFIHIYYLYSMVSTDRDHIRFLQIVITLMIPIEAWRGRMGALTGSLPKEVSTVTMGVGG